MELTSWQEHLEQHFGSLKNERMGLGLPVFALEHGLDENEVHALEKEIRNWIVSSSPSKNHWMVWIIYASEIGYRFAGNEYWQTFESETPGWADFGDRYIIRRWFKKFHSEFNGAIPSGTWANHFSIIAWPITHALLPKDLQLQTAKILFEIRYQLTREIIQNIDDLGKIIKNHSWCATSRFQNFCQQYSLVGQIAAALIYGQSSSKNLIFPDTLKRIVSDLDRTRNGRLWLKEARNASQQVQIKGLSRRRIKRGSSDDPEERTQEQATFLGIEPQLVLRRSKTNDWDAYLEIPDFTPLLNEFPEFQNFFRESKCIIECSSEGWKGRSWLLYGPYSLKLKKWPDPTTPLIRLEKNNEKLNFLLRTECLLRPASLWLFHIADDKLNREVKGKIVRPGQRYVVVSTDQKFPQMKYLENCSISCSGVIAAIIDLPDHLSVAEIESLERLGLVVKSSLKVWPVGMAARRWDGEGYSEWLTTEKPILGISCNRSVDRLTVKLNEEEEENLFPTVEEEPLFIQLPLLPEGFHLLQVLAELKSTDSSNPEKVNGNLELIVRKPKPWMPGTTLHSGLIVLKDPSEPTLEQLWQNKLSVNIFGPASRGVKCRVTLLGEKGEKPLHKETLPEKSLPINPNDWIKYFSPLCNKPKIIEHLEMSSSCLVEILGGELGTFKFLAEREFTPLRWVSRRQGNKYKIRLIDDTGTNQKTSVEFYEFIAPDEKKIIPEDQITGMKNFAEKEGLYAANNGIASCNLIFLPTKATSLADLEFRPALKGYIRNVGDLKQIICLNELWGSAQVIGQVLAIIRQRKVMEALQRKLTCLICGKKWIEAESYFLKNPKDQGSLDKFGDALKSKPKSFHVLIKNKFVELIDIPPNERVSWFAEKSKKFGIYGNRELCEFALRLATSPQTIRHWADEKIDKYLEEILDQPILMRAARMLGLLIAEEHEFQGSNWLPLSRGWPW
ncbi:hypothetical protein UZ36_06805 [Candidatus Nitromaritima sp. SCGC AAA799-C22]|nr:hypothetical protein UZ36_06805 [Candidatus Nitromaritima sp. SCGC AAA799-C22]